MRKLLLIFNTKYKSVSFVVHFTVITQDKVVFTSCCI